MDIVCSVNILESVTSIETEPNCQKAKRFRERAHTSATHSFITLREAAGGRSGPPIMSTGLSPNRFVSDCRTVCA